MRPVGPYHEAELAVHERAGVSEMARRIGRSIRAEIPPVAAAFLAQQRLAVMGWVDDGDGEQRGRVWASALFGEPGFISADGSGLVGIRAELAPGDPLAERARPPADVGLLVIDFATRRRMRINGVASGERPQAFGVRPDQVYSNCPKYIQAREVRRGEAAPGPAARSSSLTGAQAALLARTDTFFIATYHAEGGADASHRGGSPGFVRVAEDGGSLSWPDYPGNAMFQTLGNIAADDRTGLLVIDFDSGSTLQLSGSARIVWQPERRVEFRVERSIEIPAALPLRWRFVAASPFNP